MQFTKHRHFHLAALSLLFLCCYSLIFDQKPDLNGDNVSYYWLGRALSEGYGYVNLAFPGNPTEHHFPIGYPLIIALFQSIGIKNFLFFKLLNGVLLFACALLFYNAFNAVQKNKMLSFLSAAALLASPALLRSASIVMSEIPLMFFMALLFYLLTRISETPKPKTLLIAIFLLASFAMLIKSIAIAVFIAVSVYLWFTPKRKWAYVFALAGMGVWLVYQFLPLGGENYFNQMLLKNPYNANEGFVGIADVFMRVAFNLRDYAFVHIPEIVLPPLFYSLKKARILALLPGVLSLLFFYYGRKAFGKYTVFVGVFLLASLAIVFIWPVVWASHRFVLPLLPFMVFIVFNGMFVLGKKIDDTYLGDANKLGILPIIILLIFNAVWINDLRIKAQQAYPMVWKNYFSVAEYCRKNTDLDAVVASRKPVLFFHFSQRKSVSYLESENEKEVLQDLVDKQVDYIVLDDIGFAGTEKYLFPALRTYKDYIDEEFSTQNPKSFLLKLNKEKWKSHEKNID